MGTEDLPCTLQTLQSIPSSIISTFFSSELILDEAGDIRWKLHQTPSDYLPFLACDSYELAPCPDCKVILH